MNIEYEATFYDVDKDFLRKKLRDIGAKLIRPEFMQKRTVFNPPSGYDGHCWLRVRDEGDKITMSYKEIGDGKTIEGQKEIELIIDNYKIGVNILKALKCDQKAYQETKRELWQYKNVEICIDEWPWLKPWVEFEGKNEAEVKNACTDAGFDYKEAIFDSADAIYSSEYNVTRDEVNNKTPLIKFGMKNPFNKQKSAIKN